MSSKGLFRSAAEEWDDRAQEGGATEPALPTLQIDRILQLPPDQIQPDPEQPRKHFDETALAELAQTISEQGIVQPLTVTKLADGTLRLVAGERRLRAAKLLGLESVPARMCAPEAAPFVALIENLQRKDLNPMEEAQGLHRLKLLYGLTDEQIAEKVGKPRTVVTESLSLLRLPDPIREECRTSDKYPKSLLLNVLRAETDEIRDRVWTAIKDGKVTTVKDAKRFLAPAKPKVGRPKHYTYRKKTPEYELTVRLKNGRDVAAVRTALEHALTALD